ncbi:MAG TPA: hypothetical protein PLY68_07305 [Myxococcota bacterium]|nr:hypothetical protein [Myxococcota bacterium]HNZ03684.1 hypothetical protein [Myxococcota bacterium]HPB51241.1 hypothetical protein [Myxococcota bacterium]HQP95985.1 hypothetical protein [Myxococcota bacterium]
MISVIRLRLTWALLVLAIMPLIACNFPGRAGECMVDDDCPYSTDTCYDHFCYSPGELADMDIIDTPEVE